MATAAPCLFLDTVNLVYSLADMSRMQGRRKVGAIDLQKPCGCKAHDSVPRHQSSRAPTPYTTENKTGTLNILLCISATKPKTTLRIFVLFNTILLRMLKVYVRLFPSALSRDLSGPRRLRVCMRKRKMHPFIDDYFS